MQLGPEGARLDLALAAARETAEIVLPHFRRGVTPDIKADGSPVTIADRACEEHLRRRIPEAFPGDAILGEEFGERAGDSGYRWHLDPIDGTKTFISGVPLWGTLVGVEHEGRFVAGVANYPALNETLYATRGHGAWHQSGRSEPKQARVSQTDNLSEALVCFTSAPAFERRGEWSFFHEMCKQCRIARGWGDCYGWLLVATGRADVMLDTHVKTWDLAPFAVILPEAGGTLTDWNGERRITGGEGLATNGKLLDQVLKTRRDAEIPY
jgi:histidinol-phosphatase